MHYRLQDLKSKSTHKRKNASVNPQNTVVVEEFQEISPEHTTAQQLQKVAKYSTLVPMP